MRKNEQNPESTTAQALPHVSSAGVSWNSLRVYSESCPPPPDRIFEPSLPEHCIILHVANSDRLERRLDGGRWLSSPSHPGGITFVPAHQTAEWLWDAEVELLHLYVPPKLIERVALESFGVAPHKVELIDRFATRDRLIEQLALTLKAELERQSMASQLYLESLQNVLAVHLLRNHCTVEVPSVPVKGGLPQYKLRQVIDYIQSHLSDDLGLAELANVVQMSPYHFGKLFKQSTGMAPHRYMLQCRVDRAKQLLADKQLSLVQIAAQLGFCDQSHFTNVFRRHTRLTPRQYRDSLLGQHSRCTSLIFTPSIILGPLQNIPVLNVGYEE